MSSQHQYMSVNNTPSARIGDIEHISHLSEHIGSLCLSSEYSDVTLIVEGQRIPAHKVILAASSDYFRALLYGGMREANQAEVELQAPLQAFKALLRYVYSGHMGLSMLREDTVLDMLGLAHQFNFQELETAISDYLRQVLALRNVCSVLDAARLYGLKALMDYCYNFLDRNAVEVLQHDTFLQLSVEALQGLLERDSFFAPEADIFKAVCNWFNANQQWVKSEAGQAQVEKILKCVRLTLMTLEELLTVVRPFSLVTPDMLLDAIQEKTQTKSTDLRHRGLLCNHWSSKWRGLRDTYYKFKKNNECGPSSRKYRWPWGEQMRFIEDYNERGFTGSNSDNADQAQDILKDIFSQSSIDLYSPDERDSVPVVSKTFAPELKKRKFKYRAKPADRVLEYLRFKCDQRAKLDAVDYFFLSYAKNFKKLPNRMQSMLRLDITTLFTRYELQAEAEGLRSAKMSCKISQFDYSGISEDAWASAFCSSDEGNRAQAVISDVTNCSTVPKKTPEKVVVHGEIASTSQIVLTSLQREIDLPYLFYTPALSMTDFKCRKLTVSNLDMCAVTQRATSPNVTAPRAIPAAGQPPTVQLDDLTHKNLQESTNLHFTKYYDVMAKHSKKYYSEYYEYDTDTE
ncbi:uncharacterized protein LOC110374871 isoform X2 [Helicoverpa armigera]|uniref:uncharacterized protein LOC110374871 isoform X2 n=1 Tax=Helicoverpa armigera TaxID=29058 RepID=UPI0030837131